MANRPERYLWYFGFTLIYAAFSPPFAVHIQASDVVFLTFGVAATATLLGGFAISVHRRLQKPAPDAPGLAALEPDPHWQKPWRRNAFAACLMIWMMGVTAVPWTLQTPQFLSVFLTKLGYMDEVTEFKTSLALFLTNGLYDNY